MTKQKVEKNIVILSVVMLILVMIRPIIVRAEKVADYTMAQSYAIEVYNATKFSYSWPVESVDNTHVFNTIGRMVVWYDETKQREAVKDEFLEIEPAKKSLVEQKNTILALRESGKTKLKELEEKGENKNEIGTLKVASYIIDEAINIITIYEQEHPSTPEPTPPNPAEPTPPKPTEPMDITKEVEAAINLAQHWITDSATSMEEKDKMLIMNENTNVFSEEKKKIIKDGALKMLSGKIKSDVDPIIQEGKTKKTNLEEYVQKISDTANVTIKDLTKRKLEKTIQQLNYTIQILEQEKNDTAGDRYKTWEENLNGESEGKKTISGTILLGSAGTISGKNEKIDPDEFTPGQVQSPQKITRIAQTIIDTIKVLGVVIAVITLILIGYKYMTGSISEKAEYKKTLVPYIVGIILLANLGWIIELIANIVTNIKI